MTSPKQNETELITRLDRINQAACDMVGHNHWDHEGTRGANCNYCIVQRASMETISTELHALRAALSAPPVATGEQTWAVPPIPPLATSIDNDIADWIQSERDDYSRAYLFLHARDIATRHIRRTPEHEGGSADGLINAFKYAVADLEMVNTGDSKASANVRYIKAREALRAALRHEGGSVAPLEYVCTRGHRSKIALKSEERGRMECLSCGQPEQQEKPVVCEHNCPTCGMIMVCEVCNE